MIEKFLTEQQAALRAFRHDLHEHPELSFEEFRTARLVAEEVRRLGYQVTTDMGGTAVIATLSNGSGRRAIGLRADMDALPIHETTNLTYASKSEGKMHACGHDGHTTMLLGVARYLAANRNFDGTVHLIFQPAEEDISGAKRLVDEGIFKRFPCDAVFSMHNIPGVPMGQIMVRPGPITAAVDIVDVVIRGVGGHGAVPHHAIDPIVAASSAVIALQSIVARNVDAHDQAVITVGSFQSGNNATIIPEEARLSIGVRSTTKEVRTLLAKRIPELLTAQAKSFGCTAEVRYAEGISYPPGFNAPAEAALVRDIAMELGQPPAQVDMRGPFMFSEDFAFFQQEVPGCMFGIGNGDTRMLHDPGYDFNDGLLLNGTAVWARIVEKALPVAAG